MILAGGSGTRLWPASRRSRPKQLLALGPDGVPMVAAAAALGGQIGGVASVVIVTAESQAEATRALVPGVEVVAEPVGRNTAAAIGLAAALLVARDPDAVLAILPADQHVTDRAGLARVLGIAMDAAEQGPIATVGITPSRVETGFGYLEIASTTPGTVTPVLRFVEKPDAETAAGYVASGRYLWNAGIFCARADRLLAELDAHLPGTGHAVREIARNPAIAASVYPTLPSISIDHAVMEKASGIVTVPAAVGWDDVGSWAALPAVRGADAAGNTVVGNALVIDGGGNVIVTDDLLVATVGVSDLVVVKSGDAILVIKKDQAQDVRKVIDALSARGLARYL